MLRTWFCDGWEFSRNGGPFEPVIVPHDAMLGELRGPDAPAGSASGYYYGGSYRYRKEFLLDAVTAAGTVVLEFEGVYRDACILVNGQAVDAPPYVFIPFFIDCTDLVHEGANSIELACSNEDQPDCRWYSGAGLYRPIWLWTGSSTRILPQGVRVTTLAIDPAIVRVDVECTNGLPHIRILDVDGACLVEGDEVHVELALSNAQLWSSDNPKLYSCEVTTEESLHAVAYPQQQRLCAFAQLRKLTRCKQEASPLLL